MRVDQSRGHLYTSCDQVISVVDLNAEKIGFLKVMKTKNMRPKCLEYDADTQRLFVGSKDGMFIIFDTSQPNCFVPIHYLRLIKQRSKNYIKAMGLDKMRNILMC